LLKDGEEKAEPHE